MANLNRIILVGRLTADPESRATLDGLPMTKFRLTVARQPSGVDLIDVVAWRRLAEVCSEYLKKGQLVLVDGRIQIRSFEDQTGQRRWATEVVARNMTMLERGVGDQGAKGLGDLESGKAGMEPAEELADDADLASDLPF